LASEGWVNTSNTPQTFLIQSLASFYVKIHSMKDN
jgi:hypothetical protein